MTGTEDGETGKGKGKPRLRLVGGKDAGKARGARSKGGKPVGVQPAGGPALVGEVLPPRAPKTRGPILPGLNVTAREDAFAKAVILNGCSKTEAYRRTHDASGMTDATAWRQAQKVADRDRVRARMDELLQQKEGSALHDRRKALAWALERLQQEAETAETDGARVAAVSLVMRHHALLTDRTEDATAEPRDAAEVERQLRDRLAKLLGTGTEG